MHHHYFFLTVARFLADVFLRAAARAFASSSDSATSSGIGSGAHRGAIFPSNSFVMVATLSATWRDFFESASDQPLMYRKL